MNGAPTPSSAIVQIDKATAQVTNSSTLADVPQGQGWAFAFWGGDFYTFTAPGSASVVTRFRPSDGSIVQVARIEDLAFCSRSLFSATTRCVGMRFGHQWPPGLLIDEPILNGLVQFVNNAIRLPFAILQISRPL